MPTSTVTGSLNQTLLVSDGSLLDLNKYGASEYYLNFLDITNNTLSLHLMIGSLIYNNLTSASGTVVLRIGQGIEYHLIKGSYINVNLVSIGFIPSSHKFIAQITVRPIMPNPTPTPLCQIQW